MLHENQGTMSVETYIKPLLDYVLRRSKFSIFTHDSVKLCSVSSSGAGSKADRFTLSIPYAGEKLNWYILFDAQYPDLGPDFVFCDETFLADPDLGTLKRYVPSLANWNRNNDYSLNKVIKELVRCYKDHQVKQMERYAAPLYHEYRNLLRSKEMSVHDVEAIVLPTGNKREAREVRFLIHFVVDLSRLPYVDMCNRNENVILAVTYDGHELSRMHAYLTFSKTVEGAYMRSELTSVQLPPFKPNKHLSTYVAETKKCIYEKVDQLAIRYERKRAFVSAILATQRCSVIEFDANDFSHVMLLQEFRDFYYNLVVRLPTDFPNNKPLIHMQSIYHITPLGKLYFMPVNDYPYSTKWDDLSQWMRILKHVCERYVAKFQQLSVRSSNPF